MELLTTKGQVIDQLFQLVKKLPSEKGCLDRIKPQKHKSLSQHPKCAGLVVVTN